MGFNIERIASKLTGRTFRYQAVLKYTSDPLNGQAYATRLVEFGIVEREPKTFSRRVKKAVVGNFFDQMPKHMLKNGILSLENISYLGFF